MLKNSVFFRLLVSALCACLLVTVIAVIAKNSGGTGDSKVNTPTDTTPIDTTPTVTKPTVTTQKPEVTTVPGDTDDPIIVDENKTIVAANGMNSYFAWSQYGEGSEYVAVCVVSNLEPGAKYRLVFSIEKDSLPNGCELGHNQKYLLALSGNNSVGNALSQTKTEFVDLSGLLSADETIDFFVNDTFFYVSDDSGKAAMVFVFASFPAGNIEEAEADAITKQISDCIVFKLYEITESGS